MRPQDSVHLRHAQLLSLRDQLQAKADNLTRELDGKKAGVGSGARRSGAPPGSGNVTNLASKLESINI